MDNEGRGYAKTRQNREDADQMYVPCETTENYGVIEKQMGNCCVGWAERVFQMLFDVVD